MKHSYNFKHLVGQKFGKLTVIKLEKIINGKVYWYCQCDCGNEISVPRNSLTSGNTKSCGCYKKSLDKTRSVKHGLTNTRIYKIWQGIKKRCNNPKSNSFKFYGARGIKVCKEWQEDFICFYNWAIKNGYKDNLTIDRIDNNGNYEPSNCKWITQAEQTKNKRDNVKITIKGETKLLSDWARESGIDRRTISKRITLGWSEEELLRPVDKMHKLKRRRGYSGTKLTNNGASKTIFSS